jgi:hypothetical protein
MKSVAELVSAGLAKCVEVGDCLEWQGKMGNSGKVPAVMSRAHHPYSAEYPIPRELWKQHKGPIPEGMLVYRTCCNNKCVALDHLAIGTRAQWHKNRKKQGKSKHTAAHIASITQARRKSPDVVNTLEKARHVRSLLGEYTREEVSRMTGVSEAMVRDIARERAWKDQSNPFNGLGAR